MDCRRKKFEYDRIVAEIRQKKSSRVALQFSASLMTEAPTVVWELEDLLGSQVEFYVLGDLQRGGAVDTIGAAHVEAELIVHIGANCLSVPAEGTACVVVCGTFFGHSRHSGYCRHLLYVLAEAGHVDVGAAVQAVCEELDDDISRVVVVYEPLYARAAPDFGKALERKLGCETVVGELPAHVTGRTADGVLIAGLQVAGDETELRDSSVIFIGSGGDAALRCASCSAFVTYDPKTGRAKRCDATRALSKRHHALQRASKATRWGIVVADAGRVGLVTDIAFRCEAELAAANRSAYLLALGNPTPLKLANFAEIQAFVVLGADATFLDELGRESNVPVVSVDEMRSALGTLTWLPDDQEDRPFYSTDLRDAARHSQFVENKSDDEILQFMPPSTQQASEASNPTPAQALCRPRRDLTYTDGPIVRRHSEAIDFLVRREYRGLDPRLGQTPASAAETGIDGVASGYAHETAKSSS